MSRIPSASPEVGVIRTYVDWLVGLPWNVSTDDRLDIKEAAQILDEDHYGLEKVKERILEYLAVRSLADTIRSPILLFVGPPGVGKTSLGKSIAKAMGRKFTRMSLGGIHDEAEIRGHRRTYIGALPGRIIQSIKTGGTNNPVFMLDEVDKIGMDFRGDPSSALLEVLDPEQNFSFQDNYLEVPFDLRKVLFIATANLADPIPAPLRDRMELIQLPGYTQQEKVEIGRRFLVPKQMENHGLTAKHIEITDEVLTALVQAYTKEAGVRSLERELANIMRKVARSVAEGRKRKTVVDVKKLEEYLGPPRFEYGELEAEDQTGSATGLVVTEVGGDVVAVEVTMMEGKEDFILTGQLGDVMRESARAALSWIRSHAADLGIERDKFEKHTLHIHVPAGAIPKDGPSAGVTMATAMVSALTGIPVRKDVAMTGEITLRGRVLPIGGLKSKILAAHLSGAGMVILPKKNEKDLRDIPEEVRKSIKLVLADSMEQVLDAALRRRPKPLKAVPPTVIEGGDKLPKPEPQSPVRRGNFPPAGDQPPVVVKGS
jgi:ATP-dependent Lon protease